MAISPGTPLYNLPLLGEGTGQVESLTSYIVRLARAHYVRPRDLIRRVAGAECPEVVALCYARFFSRHAITVNGLGKYARLFTDRFGKLTGNPNLVHATLLPWYRLLAPNGSALLAPHPRWCGQCLMEDVQAGRGRYLRLAWSVGLEKYCTEHHALLDSVCPSCGRIQPAIPQCADLLHCDHCHQPLVSQETLHRPSGAKPAANDLLTAQSITELIALNAVINPETTHLKFTAQLSREVERRAESNRAAFSAAIGLQARALNGWLGKEQRISLDLLLHVCQATGLLPALLFAKGRPGIGGQMSMLQRRRARERGYHSPAVRQRARNLLSRALASPTTAPGLSSLAKQLGVSRGYLRYWHSDLASDLAMKRKRDAQQRARQSAAMRQEIIRTTVQQTLSNGDWPGRKRTESLLRKAGVSLLDASAFRAYQASILEWLAHSSKRE